MFQVTFTYVLVLVGVNSFLPLALMRTSVRHRPQSASEPRRRTQYVIRAEAAEDKIPGPHWDPNGTPAVPQWDPQRYPNGTQ